MIVVVVAGLGFWMFVGFDDTTVTDAPVEDTSSITAADPVREPEALVGPAPGLDDLIDEAQLAANAGLIFDPPGSNAIELYLSALELAPGDPVAETELRQVIDQALGMAESAMLERRGEDAAAALERVALADPDNLRLPFLNAQLAQMQLRNSLDDARVAIREGRFEDASQALDGARALAASDATEVDVVADELSAALNAQQVDEILLKANARLEAGDLIAPSNDNARFYYELALSIDRDSTGARQGLLVIAGKLVLQARTSIDNGDFDGADALLADARRLDPSIGREKSVCEK